MPSKGSPSGRSMCTTSAPLSPSSIAADGPATPHERSSTFTPLSTPVMDATSRRLAQDQTTGRHARPGRDDHVIDLVGLARRRAPHQAHRLSHAVDAVDVGLAQLSSVGVRGETTVQLQVAVGDEVPGLTPSAETELF